MFEIEWVYPSKRLTVSANTHPVYAIVEESEQVVPLVKKRGFGVVLGSCKTVDEAKAVIKDHYEGLLQERSISPEEALIRLRTPARPHVLPDQAG